MDSFLQRCGVFILYCITANTLFQKYIRLIHCIFVCAGQGKTKEAKETDTLRTPRSSDADMAALDDANAGGVEETPDPSVTQIGSGGIAAGDGSESGDGGVNSGEGEGGGFAGEARGDAGEGGGEARGEAGEGGGDGGKDDGEDSNDSGEGSGNRGNSPTPPPLTDAWQVTVEVESREGEAAANGQKDGACRNRV